MKASSILLLASGLMIGTSAFGQTTPPADTRPEKPARGPNAHASDNAKKVHELLAGFKAQREEYIAARRVILERLKTATEEERKAILEELRASQKDRVEEQRALGKEIRGEMKKVRETRKNGTG